MNYDSNLRGGEYEEKAGKILGIFLYINIINLAIRQLTNVPQLVVTGVLGSIYLIALLREYNILLRGSNIVKLLLLEIALTTLVVSSCMKYPFAESDILRNCIWTMVFCLPLYIIARNIKRREIMILQTVRPAMVVVIISLFIVCYQCIYSSQIRYNMPIGYALLYPTLLFWHLRGKSKLYILLFSIGAFIILAYGSRGPLIGIAVFILSSLFDKGASAKIIPIKMLVVFLVLCVAPNLSAILECLNSTMMSIGLDSRNVSLIIENDVTNDSGRINIYYLFVELISRNLITGYGVSADIALLGYYPHNIFIELVFDFGIILGGLLSSVLIIKILKDIIVKKDDDKRISILFICAAVIPLMISGTYLKAPMIWFYLGLCNTHGLRVRVKL